MKSRCTSQVRTLPKSVSPRPRPCASIAVRAPPSDHRRAGPLRLSNEAELSSLRLQLPSLPLRGFADKDGSLPALAHLLVERLIELLSVHKISQAYPAAPDSLGNEVRGYPLEGALLPPRPPVVAEHFT